MESGQGGGAGGGLNRGAGPHQKCVCIKRTSVRWFISNAPLRPCCSPLQLLPLDPVRGDLRRASAAAGGLALVEGGVLPGEVSTGAREEAQERVSRDALPHIGFYLRSSNLHLALVRAGMAPWPAHHNSVRVGVALMIATPWPGTTAEYPCSWTPRSRCSQIFRTCARGEPQKVTSRCLAAERLQCCKR